MQVGCAREVFRTTVQYLRVKQHDIKRTIRVLKGKLKLFNFILFLLFVVVMALKIHTL